MEFTLLPGLKLGAASAPAQIEGGNVAHQWNAWADAGHIKDRTSPRRADDHFTRWREDIDLMRSMGLQIYRLGIDWARIEPIEGSFDESAIAYYRELLTYLKECEIEPLLTLHHFANPVWFEEKGAFARKENAEAFLRFVEYAVRGLGDLASDYITINEPNVYATLGYFGGGFPPGENSMKAACQVMSVLAGCHIQAYGRIHAIRRDMGFEDTRVSFAHHMRSFAPLHPMNPWHRLCAVLTRHMFQGAVTAACLKGRFSWPLKNLYGAKQGEYADFLALNYYTRSSVSGLGDGTADNVPKNDLGWEIYPDGIAQCARDLYKALPRPIAITENGTCDNTDSFRALYIAQHLRVLCQSGLPVERYYHWCFTDNFEWLEGESARFGLVHVDYETQARTIKRSGKFFSDLIREGGVTQALYEEYLAKEAYHH